MSLSEKSQKPSNIVVKTFLVALTLSVCCSMLVTTSVVLLKDRQTINQKIYKRSNVLKAAGIEVSSTKVNEVFDSRVKTMYIDLATGKYVDKPDLSGKEFDSIAAAKDPAFRVNIPADEDLAKIKKRSSVSEIYILEAEKTDLSDSSLSSSSMVILPVRGKGLWSTMKGFIALTTDFQIKGLSFFAHAETPGLGGEIDNPNWQKLWQGKKLFDDSGKVALRVIKGAVLENDPEFAYKVDGLSGATITSDGVTKMIKYWLGDQGYGPFLNKLVTSQ